jgi:hypothetical protein
VGVREDTAAVAQREQDARHMQLTELGVELEEQKAALARQEAATTAAARCVLWLPGCALREDGAVRCVSQRGAREFGRPCR